MSIWRLMQIMKTIRNKFRFRELKRLGWLVKFWFNEAPYDYGYALQLLEWELNELLKTYQSFDFCNNQEDDETSLKMFLFHLDQLIKDDYGDIREIGIDEYNRRYEENKQEMTRWFSEIDKWWV